MSWFFHGRNGLEIHIELRVQKLTGKYCALGVGEVSLCKELKGIYCSFPPVLETESRAMCNFYTTDGASQARQGLFLSIFGE